MPNTPRPSYPAMIAILGVLFCVAPATIDACLPAFDAIGAEFSVSQQAVQGTLGIYTAAYAAMLLLHGRLSDSVGRKTVICASLAMYVLATLLAAAAPSFGWLLSARVGQGISAGAGIVVGQAIIRDCYRGARAQRAMSHTLMAFNISPALAPVVAGYLVQALGWRSVFAFMALLSLLALFLCATRLPETLPRHKRLPFSASGLCADYRQLGRDYRFMGACLSASLLVAGQAFIIGAAPDLVTGVLAMQPRDFGYLFIPLVMGAMSGAWLSARLAGKLKQHAIIMAGQALMATAALLTLAFGLRPPPFGPGLVFALSLFIGGLSLCVPCITLHILSRSASASGTAASALGAMQIGAFSLVAGWCVPFIYGRPDWLGVALLGCVGASCLTWTLAARSSQEFASL